MALPLLAGLVAACSAGAPSTFTVNGASVDSAYTCPYGARNAAYDLHGKVDVRNGTSNRVVITSVGAILTLVDVHGGWLEPVGDRYDAGEVAFSPTSVGAGASAALRVTIPSACTNGKVQTRTTSYGDYSVMLTIITSTGTYRVQSANRHRIIPA